jgi:hypothetical protein
MIPSICLDVFKKPGKPSFPDINHNPLPIARILQIYTLKINIRWLRFYFRANEMVLARKIRVLTPPRAGAARRRRLQHKLLEGQITAQVIDHPKKNHLCEVYEKERKWAVCGAGNVPAKEIYIRQMEEVLVSLAKAEKSLGIVILRADKKSLNAINKSGGKHGAGDSCLSLYMDVLEQSVRSAFPAAKRTFLVRDSDSSDETFIVVAGDERMLKDSCRRFQKTYDQALGRKMKELHHYPYSENMLIEEEGILQVHPLHLDLARFSHALKNPDIVGAAHLSGPKLIANNELGHGFIGRALDELGRKEAVKSHLLPPSFSPIFIEKPGISPYIHEFPVSGFLASNAIALEMKFSHANETDKWAAFDFLEKTGKGVAEILSGRFGLRYINTFMGEAAADHIIQATAYAMKDLEIVMQCRIRRTDSKLMYIVEGSDPEILIDRIRELAKLRIGPIMGYEHAPFVPSPRAIYAGKFHANDLRAHMALHAMDLDQPTQALTYLDLMVSAAKELKPEVLSAAINGSKEKKFIKDANNAFSTMCGLIYQNPAIRDAEDLVYSIRSGVMVAQKGAEERIWAFARKWGIELRNRLLEEFRKL